MTPEMMRHSVTVRTFSSALDQYGQLRQTIASTATVELSIYPYEQAPVNNPEGIKVDAVAIGDDVSITTENQLLDGETVYNIKKVTACGRRVRLLLAIAR